MLSHALLIAAKDLRLVLLRSAGIGQAVLLGLLMVFLFSLSLNTGERLSPQAAATMFWLASLFCQVLIFQMLYAVEESNGARTGLLLLPMPTQSIWLGKLLAGFFLLAVAQLVFLPAMFAFLGQTVGAQWLWALAGLALADIGICACGSLLGALSTGHSGRESLLSIILFPLLIPLLLSAIRLTSAGLADFDEFSIPAATEEILRWLGLAASFDCVFLGAGLLLFPFMYTGDN